MKKEQNEKGHDVKTDLKHDTMEFSAESEGEDKLDTDDESYEEEEISPDELEVLNDDDIDKQAYALNAAETDRELDEDNLPEEDWMDDIPGINDDDEDEEEHRL
jgi:hypothetical protein